MKIICSDRHRGHAGAMEMRYDRMIPMCENPGRIDMIMAGLAEAGFTDAVAPGEHDIAPALQVHDPAFVSFLERVYPLWEAEFGPGGFATAYTFGMRGMAQTPNASVHSMLSCYTFDVCVPFVAGTWTAIRSALDTALEGVATIGSGKRMVFSVCRPPGHHAARDLAGGYCYMNNAAVAAQAYLNAGAARVAILDVDYHHGNGTQSIFYDRSDVLYVSLHARPEDEYPFLLGYAAETGRGAGEGFNLNLPMPRGTGFAEYRPALDLGLRRVADYAPDVLILSLGVDSHADDPVGGFRLATPDFLTLGNAVAALGLPTHVVMEGGYAMEALGRNVANAIRGLSGG